MPDRLPPLFTTALIAKPPTSAKAPAATMADIAGLIFLSMQLSPLRKVGNFRGIDAFRAAFLANDFAVFDAHNPVSVTQGSWIVCDGKHAAVLFLRDARQQSHH